VYASNSHARASNVFSSMTSDDAIEEPGGKNLLVAFGDSLEPISVTKASPKVSPRTPPMTFGFNHVDLSDDKENQQIEFDDLLDVKEVIEHFDDKDN